MSESSPLTFIGMDVSRDKIAIAMLRPGEQVPLELTIPATDEAVRRQVRRWGDPGALRICYEAGHGVRFAAPARGSRRRLHRRRTVADPRAARP